MDVKPHPPAEGRGSLFCGGTSLPVAGPGIFLRRFDIGHAEENSSEFAAAAEFIHAGFFDEHLAFVFHSLEFAELDELVDDFFADPHVLGRLADRHQRQLNEAFFDHDTIAFIHNRNVPFDAIGFYARKRNGSILSMLKAGHPGCATYKYVRNYLV